MNDHVNAAWDRLSQVIKEVDVRSANAFAYKLGLRRSENLYQIKKGNHGISKELASRINKLYPQFSIGWLLTGENVVSADTKTIDFLDNNPIQKIQTTQQFILSECLCNDAEYAVLMNDEALAPKISKGAYVLLKENKNDKYIYGHIYLIETEEFRLFRIVRKGAEGDQIRLTTLCPNVYDDIFLNSKDIKYSARVCSVVTPFHY